MTTPDWHQVNEEEFKELERIEQQLIDKGGLFPHPWSLSVNKGFTEVIIVASNGKEVAKIMAGELVAHWIKNQFNRHPVVFLENDTYYY